MSRRPRPTHKGSANRRRRARPRHLPTDDDPRGYEAMAASLVARGLASRRILTNEGNTR